MSRVIGWLADRGAGTLLHIALNIPQQMAWLWTPRLHYDTSEFTGLEPLAQAFEDRKRTMDNPNIRMTREWIEKWQLDLMKELKKSDSDWVSNVFALNLIWFGEARTFVCSTSRRMNISCILRALCCLQPYPLNI
jgi:hypothetical protein